MPAVGTPHPPGSRLSHRQARVLIAGKSQAFRRHVADALASEGFTAVEEADDPGTVIAAIYRDPPHLLLVELGNGDPAPPERAILEEVARLPAERASRAIVLIGAGDIALSAELIHLVADWMPRDAGASMLARRARINAELAVLHRHIESVGKAAAESIRQRIDRLEEGLVLLRAAHDRLNEELRCAQRRQKDWAGMSVGMLDELRTPLNAISGFAEIMKEETHGPLGNDTYRDYVASIHEASQHLISVASELLDLYRLEAGQIALAPQTFDPRAAIKSVADMLSDQAQRAGVMLLADAPKRLPTLESDERRVKQILFNMVDNAIRYTPRGGRVVIRATGEAKSRQLSFSVSDSAAASGAAQPDSLQQPIGGEQAAASPGLALSKLLAERLSGRFDLEMRPGIGTTATVTLPLHWQASP